MRHWETKEYDTSILSLNIEPFIHCCVLTLEAAGYVLYLEL